jgi:hypothetical protein
MTTIVAGRPGARVQGYRNSRPRQVKLIGLGDTARMLAEDIAAALGPGVLLGAADAALPLDAPVGGVQPGALVLVMHALDGAPGLPAVVERTAATLSVVLLEPPGLRPGAAAQEATNRIRGVADMFASTSDPDFVRDLVANLAS